MLDIDASYGEGGGQILRSALTLSAITGKAVHLSNIRASRSKPGLRPQHLLAVRAAGRVCRASVSGDALNSSDVTFEPRCDPTSGNFHFNVSDVVAGGSAGSVTLVSQTLFLPLALAEGPSAVTLIGGTTVPMSPPALYLEKVYLPALFNMGVRATLDHRVWGFNPTGEGELSFTVRGGARLRGIRLADPGPLLRVEGVAFAAKLPSHIPQRMANRARSVLKDMGIEARIVPQHVPSPGLGTGLFLCARYEHTQAGFLSLGRIRLPSEAVAEIACRALGAHHRTGAAADPHLGDQLVLPVALAEEPSYVTVSRVTRHLLTNVWVAQQFGFDGVTVGGQEGEPGILRSVVC